MKTVISDRLKTETKRDQLAQIKKLTTVVADTRLQVGRSDNPAPSLRVKSLRPQPVDQGEDSQASIDECSPPGKSEEVLESDELKRQLSGAEEWLRSPGSSPKKAKSGSR